ncbi:MAG: hypothetical protein GY754_34415 [bacterium]|nr:hypothetical protein [bacterium]
MEFSDDELAEDINTEKIKGQIGLIDPDSAIPAGELKSPNMYLYGEISDTVRYVNDKKLQYLVITLKLKSLETGKQLWQDQKEILKASRTGKITLD